MISRHYVNKTLSNGEQGWGLMYTTDEQARNANEMMDEYHLEECNHDDGRWYLLLDGSEFISHDLPYLEMLLRLWIMEDHHTDKPIGDTYDFMASGYTFGWVVADAGPRPWDEDYGQPLSRRVYIDESAGLQDLEQMQNRDGRNLFLMPVAWDPTDGTNEYVCCSSSPTRIEIPKCGRPQRPGHRQEEYSHMTTCELDIDGCNEEQIEEMMDIIERCCADVCGCRCMRPEDPGSTVYLQSKAKEDLIHLQYRIALAFDRAGYDCDLNDPVTGFTS